MFKNFMKSIRNYKVRYIKDDLSAGFSVASISLPQAMAFALIVGINPIYGIYTHIVATISASFLSISDYMIIGPTNIIAVAIASNMKVISPENYLQSVFILTMMVGIIQLILGFLKLGNLVNYVSQAVVIGLTTGVAIIIASGQIGNVLGIIPQNEYNVITTLYSVFTKLNQVNPYALSIGLVSALIIILVKKINIRIPPYLVAIIFSIFLVKILGLEGNLNIVGGFEATLPRPHLVDIKPGILKNLLSSSLSIAILGFIQILSIIKALERKSDKVLNVNHEFVNLGIINMICSVFNGFVVTGSFTKSFTNYEAGARSRLSGLISGLVTLIFVLIFTPIVKSIPIATLSVIVIMVAYKMIELEEIMKCFKTTRFDTIVFMATFITTILSPRLDYAVYLGVILSGIIVLKRTSKINSTYFAYDREDDSFFSKKLSEVEEDDYVVINLSGIMQFNVSDNLKEEFDRSTIENDKYIIRMRDIEYIDITTIQELERFVNNVKSREGEVYLSGVNDKIYDRLREYGILNMIDEDHIFTAEEELFSSTKDAIDEIE